MRLEQALGRLKPLASNLDDPPVGEGVALDQDCSLLRELVVELKVVRDIAELFLDLAHSLEICCAVEGVPAAKEEADELPGNVAAGNVETAREVVENGGFVDGDNVCDAVARVDDYAGGYTLCVEGENGLDGDVDALEAVPLKHYFDHLLAVAERVEWGLGEQDLAAGRVDLELFKEGVVPEVLHVVPFPYNSIFHLLPLAIPFPSLSPPHLRGALRDS